MAAAVTEQSVEAAAAQGEFPAGRRLREAGGVRETAPAYGGIGGFVTDEDGTELDVWIGVVDRELSGECDCGDGARDHDQDSGSDPVAEGLCAHAIALALDAISSGLHWAPAPLRDAGEEEDEFGAEPDPAAVFAALGAEQKSRLFDALLESHPELRPEAADLAESLL